MENNREIEPKLSDENSGSQPKCMEMSFADAIRICLKEKFATFKGRASRLEYGYFFLFRFILMLVAEIQVGVFDSLPSFVKEAYAGNFFSMFFDFSMSNMAIRLYILCFIGLLIPYAAVTARRLHDSGKSGMWAIFSLFPGFDFFVLVYMATMERQKCYNEYGPYVEVKRR